MDDAELYRKLGMKPLDSETFGSEDTGNDTESATENSRLDFMDEVHQGFSSESDPAVEADLVAEGYGEEDPWTDFARCENGRIKLDYDSPLEDFIVLVALLAGLGALIGVINLVTGNWDSEIWGLLLGGVAICGGGMWLRGNTDCHWFLDTVRREIAFHRQIFNWKQEWAVGGFDQVRAVGVQAVHKSTKNSSWWEYWTAILLQNGQILKVSDAVKHEPGKNEKLTEELARFFGVTAVPCKLETPLKVDVAADGRNKILVHSQGSSMGSAAVIIILFGVIALIGVVALAVFSNM